MGKLKSFNIPNNLSIKYLRISIHVRKNVTVMITKKLDFKKPTQSWISCPQLKVQHLSDILLMLNNMLFILFLNFFCSCPLYSSGKSSDAPLIN